MKAKKKYSLALAFSCHQNWDDMAPAEKGRHCATCDKQVIDMTKMSDKEIHGLLTKADGKVCGRLDHSQLERDLNLDKPSPAKKLAAAAIAALTITALELQSEEGQKLGKVKIEQVDSLKESTEKHQEEKKAKLISISGKVADYEGEALPAATVRIIGTKYGAKAKMDGTFVIKDIDTTGRDTLEIKVSYIGLKTWEKILYISEIKDEFILNIKLEDMPGTPMVGVIDMSPKAVNPEQIGSMQRMRLNEEKR